MMSFMTRRDSEIPRPLIVGLVTGVIAVPCLLVAFIIGSFFVVKLGICPDSPYWWIAVFERLPLLLLLGGALIGFIVGVRSIRPES
jgi:hypothetical protein